MLEIGMKAPQFILKDAKGRDVSLSDFLGKKVVLYFYPRDNTPGCTRQACAFAGAYNAFREKSVEVIGISKDSVSSHEKFAEKYGLPFILLSDPDRAAGEEAVWKSQLWRSAHHIFDRRAGKYRKDYAQGETGHKRR